MKKCIYLLAIMMMAVLNQSCEPNLNIDGTIYGVVTDAATGEPIEGCVIYLPHDIPECGVGAKRILPGGCYDLYDVEPQKNRAQITDEEGRFRFNFVPVGEYMIAAVADGYNEAEKMINLRAETIEDGEDQAIIEVNFALEKAEEEPVQENDVLINLAELGDSLYTICSAINSNAASLFYSVKESLDTIHQIMRSKGYVKFYEEKESSSDYRQGTLFYSNGVQVNSTWFEEDMTNEISQLQENACVLAITYYKDGSSPMFFELAAAYILPVSPGRDYMILSTNLYDYYAATHPFQVGANNQEVAQFFTWDANVAIDSKELSFSDYDVLFAAALQAGVMSQEEYEVELSMARADGWHKEFLEQIGQPYLEVWEQIEAVHADKGCSLAGLELEKDYSSFFECHGARVVAGDWCGFEKEPEGPMTIQKRTKGERTNKAISMLERLSLLKK